MESGLGQTVCLWMPVLEITRVSWCLSVTPGWSVSLDQQHRRTRSTTMRKYFHPETEFEFQSMFYCPIYSCLCTISSHTSHVTYHFSHVTVACYPCPLCVPFSEEYKCVTYQDGRICTRQSSCYFHDPSLAPPPLPYPPFPLSSSSPFPLPSSSSPFPSLPISCSYHDEYGLGYRWSPENLTVNMGDTVKWSWTGSPFATLRSVVQVLLPAVIPWLVCLVNIHSRWTDLGTPQWWKLHMMGNNIVCPKLS